MTEDTELTADWTKRKAEEEESGDGTFVYETECKAGDREFLDEIKVKEGYKFQYFALEDGTKFNLWEELLNLKELEGTYKVYVHFVRERGFSIYCLADRRREYLARSHHKGLRGKDRASRPQQSGIYV